MHLKPKFIWKLAYSVDLSSTCKRCKCPAIHGHTTKRTIEPHENERRTIKKL